MLHPCSIHLVFAAIVVNIFGCIDCLAIPPWTEICPLPVTPHIMNSPIASVREKSGVKVDGYCAFATLGPWANQCYEARRARNYTLYAAYFGEELSEAIFEDRQKHPDDPFTFSYDHGTRKVRTAWRQFPFDDAYCEGNGWLNLPKQHLDNFTYWQDLSKHECERLLNKYPEFKSLSMTEMMHLLEGALNAVVESYRGVGGGPTLKDIHRHAAMKCLIGAGGLGCDMGNCAVNFCRLGEDGTMGHGQGECGPVKWAPKSPDFKYSWIDGIPPEVIR